jgi:hypothetical protein
MGKYKRNSKKKITKIIEYKKENGSEDTTADINYDYGFVELPEKVYEYFSGRGISKETLKKAKIQYEKGIYIPQEQKEPRNREERTQDKHVLLRLLTLFLLRTLHFTYFF